MYKLILLTCSFLYISLNLSYSQKLPNTLLWRISGHGLQKPSYLYGTMHLTDERLFNLGDSLYKAIENSEGFAIEVNPEDMTLYLIDEIKKEMKDQLSIREVLGEKEFKKYGPALSAKLKKPADKITTADIFKEKNKWVSESFRKGKMTTFLDAYLYEIARKQGKWTGGIEDMIDQAGLANSLIDKSDIEQIATEGQNKSDLEINKFIKLYTKNDLNAIDSISNLSDSAHLDALLIKRNHKMARRMDSLSTIRNMVFAVGAAHLPGKEGIISLLSKMGFKVEPVFSSKTILPENYKIKEIAIPWVQVTDQNKSYTVEMPGKASELEMYGILKMQVHYDIFSSTAFMTTAVPTPYDKSGLDSTINSMAKNLFNINNPEKIKNITINGINGKELEATSETGYKHVIVLYSENVIYMAIGIAVKKDTRSEQSLSRFLSSFHINEKKADSSIHVVHYTDSTNLFSIDVPSIPEPFKTAENDKSIYTKLMISVDNQTGTYYFLAVSNSSSGYFIENGNKTIHNIEKNTITKLTSVSFDTTYQKGESSILELNGIMSKNNLVEKAYFELKGNRWYALLAMYDTSKKNAMLYNFFNSFKILDHASPNWKFRSPSDSSITIWSPSPLNYFPKNDSSAIKSSRHYEAYDSNYANTYDIIISDIGKYYWQSSDSAFWNSILISNKSISDTLISNRFISNGTVNGMEMVIQEKGSNNYKRKKILIYGENFYTLFTAQSKGNIFSPDNNKFFEDFRFNHAPLATSLFNSKAETLLNDLDSKDSTIKAEALTALSTANFGPADIKLLYKALLKVYPTPKENENNVNEEVAKVIIKLNNDQALQIAKENYTGTNDKDIKNLLLNIISSFKTKENYLDLKNLLIASPPTKEVSYDFINNLKDSLTLISPFINDLLPLIKDPVMTAAIINVSSVLIDSNMMNVSNLIPYLQSILTFADTRYILLKKDNQEYYYADKFLINILGKINKPTTNAMLQKWLLLQNEYLNLQIINALLNNGQMISTASLMRLAGSKSSRLELYNKLKEHKKINLFPKLYLTQQNFAEAHVYNVATEENEISNLTFLNEKIFSFKGKKVRFYFYKITNSNDDEKKYQLGCAGPFSLDPLNTSVSEINGYLSNKENPDFKNIIKEESEFIKQIQDLKD